MTASPLVSDRAISTAFVDSLPDPDPSGRISRGFFAGADEVRIDLPGLARWRICRGRIEVAAEPGADLERIRLLTEITPSAAAGLLEGHAVFQAACAVAPGSDRATLVCSKFGGGKTTLLCALLRRGWTFLADDHTQVALEDGVLKAWPRLVPVRLAPATCETLGVDPSTLPTVPSIPDRLLWTPPATDLRDRAVGTVVILRRIDVRARPAPAKQARLEGLSAIRKLAHYWCHPLLPAAMGLQVRQFEIDALLTRQARIVDLRVSEAVPPEELASILEEVAS